VIPSVIQALGAPARGLVLAGVELQRRDEAAGIRNLGKKNCASDQDGSRFDPLAPWRPRHGVGAIGLAVAREFSVPHPPSSRRTVIHLDEPLTVV